MLVEKKRGEEKEKRNLNLVQKERREDADCGGGGRQGSARGKGLCVFYIYTAQMFANVYCSWTLHIVHCALPTICLRCGPLTGACCSLGLQPNLGEESP